MTDQTDTCHKASVGLVGCGRWGRNILRDLLALGCDVRVAEHDAAGRAHAQEVGASAVYEDFSGLPLNLDGYVVAVQTARHYGILKALAQTGKPVFVEKPMVPDRAQAQEIADLMGDRVFVMHKWRYHPGIEKIAQIRASGEFGSLKRLTTERLQWTQPHDDVDAFWILMPHDLAITYEIVGDLPPLTAVQASVVGDRIEALTAFLGPNPAVKLEISALHPTVRRTVSAHFDHAVVSLVDSLSDHLELHYLDRDGRATQKVEKISIDVEFPLLRELRSFILYLSGGPTPRSSASTELLIMDRLHEMRSQAQN